jgi:hypothetical protein
MFKISDIEAQQIENIEQNLSVLKQENEALNKVIRETWQPFIDLVEKLCKINIKKYTVKGFKYNSIIDGNICYANDKYFILIDLFSIEIYEKNKFNKMASISRFKDFPSVTSYRESDIYKFEELFIMIKNDYIQFIESQINTLSVNNEMKRLEMKPEFYA